MSFHLISSTFFEYPASNVRDSGYIVTFTDPPLYGKILFDGSVTFILPETFILVEEADIVPNLYPNSLFPSLNITLLKLVE